MRPQQNGFQLRINGIMGLIMVILFFVALFFIARGVFTLLAWAAPVLIVGALIINYRTVLNYLKFIWDLLRRRPLMGIIGIILSVIGFPIVSGFLFGKAILDRKIQSYQKQIQVRRDGELVDYEDVTETDTRQQKKDVLHLEVLPPVSNSKDKNTYDDFFEIDSDRK